MPTLFHKKVLATVVNDTTNTYYSDPEHDLDLGNAERFLVQVIATNVSGPSPTLTLTLETSNDRQTWLARETTPLLNGVSISGGAVKWAVENWDGGNTLPMNGCYARFGCMLGGVGSNAFLELIVEGRDGA